MCNLTEINVSDVVDQSDLNTRCWAGALIGTLQATYTDFHYLRPIWKETTEKEALIGVGMTGIGSGAVLDLDLQEAADEVVETNEEVAYALGINAAARCTTIKPSGTSSLVVGSSSGIHAWHNDYYIRRQRMAKNEALYQYLVRTNPSLLEDEVVEVLALKKRVWNMAFKECMTNPDTANFKRHIDELMLELLPSVGAVASFPQKAPEGSILRTESTMDLLDRVRKFNLEWVHPGHNDGPNKNNVSCTISVKDDEWGDVGDWMWRNRNHYNGIAVLPYHGGTYAQTPFEDITKEKYEELVGGLAAINLDLVHEDKDETDLSGEAACAGGQCEVTF